MLVKVENVLSAEEVERIRATLAAAAWVDGRATAGVESATGDSEVRGPSLSQGVWITGEPLDGVYYHAMVSNGFNTLNTHSNQLDSRKCYSASIWWEPWGQFGKRAADRCWLKVPRGAHAESAEPAGPLAARRRAGQSLTDRSRSGTRSSPPGCRGRRRSGARRGGCSR